MKRNEIGYKQKNVKLIYEKKMLTLWKQYTEWDRDRRKSKKAYADLIKEKEAKNKLIQN